MIRLQTGFYLHGFGPLKLQPPPRTAVGRARRQAKGPRPRTLALPTGDLHPPHGVRHPFSAYDLAADKLYGHINSKNHITFLEFCRYLRSLCPPETRIAIVPDNFSPRLTTQKDTRIGG
ncbi:hypothetical protein [Nonomuraea sp. NPDC049758]|uniref:hypothetical protein n=1 Tax=Nonomuraea sp. NPDC049758 TaxID=3154360 RepID=UPI0034283391